MERISKSSGFADENWNVFNYEYLNKSSRDQLIVFS